MSESLKALKKVENELKFYYQDDWEITRYPKDIAIVEKELEDLDTIKKIFDDYDLEFKLTTLREAVFLLRQLQGEKSQCWDNALNKLKALEIIKNKILDDKDYFELVARNCDLSKKEIEQVEGVLYGI